MEETPAFRNFGWIRVANFMTMFSFVTNWLDGHRVIQQRTVEVDELLYVEHLMRVPGLPEVRGGQTIPSYLLSPKMVENGWKIELERLK